MAEIEIEKELFYNRRSELSSSSSLTDSVAGPARQQYQLKLAIDEFDNKDLSWANGSEPDQIIILSLLSHAKLLFQNREYRLAINLLRNILSRAPDYPIALEMMGQCLLSTSRFDEALKCFRALVKIRCDNDSLCLVADTLYLLELDDQALIVYLDVLKRGGAPTSMLFSVYKNLGNISVRAGDYDAGEEYYDKAYTLAPESDVLLVNYGTLEIQRERFDEALARFRRAVEVNGENDRAWVGLAMVHRHKGDLELARANIERAMDICSAKPANVANRTALRLIIEWGLQDGAIDSVISHLQNYLSGNGEDAEMAFSLAKVFTYVGRLAEARLEVERVLALDPTLEGVASLKAGLDKEIKRQNHLEAELS
jgi:tetratricopeptide (TPR) repeat protein